MKTRRGVATPIAQHWYEANARRYDRLHPGLSGDVEFYAELGRGRHVLEIGAGTGRVTAAMAATAGSIVALDNAPAMLRMAARRLVGVGASLAVLCADARALPLGASFDLVVLAYCTVQHLDPGDRRMMFQALRRLLAPSGVLAFDTWHGHVTRSPRLGPVIVPVSEEEIWAELGDAGFDSVRIEGGFRSEPCEDSCTRVWQAVPNGAVGQPVILSAAKDLTAKILRCAQDDRVPGDHVPTFVKNPA